MTQVTEWISIIKVSARISLGITKSGYWILERNNEALLLVRDADFRDLLPLLEKSFGDVHLLIDSVIKNNSLLVDSNNTFSVLKLIVFGLKNSDYWADLALNWLENLTLENDIKSELQKIVESKRYSQQTRQKASKFLRGKLGKNCI